MTSNDIVASLFASPPVQAATTTFYDAMDAASTPEEIRARFLVHRLVRRFIEKYRPKYHYDDYNYEEYDDDTCPSCGGYGGCIRCDQDKEVTCSACGADATGSDWAWTGHCSRWCATSYDRRSRHRGY